MAGEFLCNLVSDKQGSPNLFHIEDVAGDHFQEYINVHLIIHLVWSENPSLENSSEKFNAAVSHSCRIFGFPYP